MNGTMAEGDTMSELSSSTNRTEQMAYFTGELGLDRTTAALLHRAERLQEKGQLEMALKYFKQVLNVKPDCAEAQTNADMTESLLHDKRDKSQSNHLPSISEEKNSTSPVVTEMDIEWSGREEIMAGCEYFPEPDEEAYRAAKSQLRKHGYGGSLLKLITNKTLSDTCTAETGWLTYMRGLARFQVTLIADSPSLAKDYEGAVVDVKKTSSPVVTEMDIEWKDYEKHWGGPPDPRTAAADAAKAHLKESGYERSLIKLIKNEVLENDILPTGIGYMSGVARFQVTLIPDSNKKNRGPIPHTNKKRPPQGKRKEPDAPPNMKKGSDDELVGAMLHLLSSPDVVSKMETDPELIGGDNRSVTIASRFADASEK